MPKEMTHWLIAGKALNRLKPGTEICNILENFRNLYLVGAVLPDTPAHILTGREKNLVKELDREFHDPRESSFAPGARLLSSLDSSITPAYLALLTGTLTHIITDSVFHPFVYYFCGADDIRKHYRLETYIDLYFMKQYSRNFRSLKKILKSGEADTKTISDFMNLYFDSESRLKPGVYKKSLRLHALIQSAWLKPSLRKTGRGLNFIPGIKIDDKLELFYPSAHKGEILEGIFSYKNPVTGEEETDSMNSLAEKAVSRIAAVTEGLAENRTGMGMSAYLQSLAGPNPLTGLPGRTSDEMEFFSEIKNIDEVIFS